MTTALCPDREPREPAPLVVERVACAADLAAVVEDRRLFNLYTYWLGLGHGPLLPGRADFHPADVWPLSSLLILADLLGTGRRVRYRFVGTEIVYQWGSDFTGRFMDEIAHGAQRALMDALYRLVTEAGAPVYARTLLQLEGGRAGAVTRRIMLPLARDGVTVDMVLTAQSTRRADEMHHELPALRLGDITQLMRECHAWVLGKVAR